MRQVFDDELTLVQERLKKQGISLTVYGRTPEKEGLLFFYLPSPLTLMEATPRGLEVRGWGLGRNNWDTFSQKK